MKPPTEHILDVVDTIRKGARGDGPSYNGVVEQYMDEKPTFREAMLLWIGDNINKDIRNFTYAEESVLTALMCSITVALVEEAREDIDVALSTFNAVLTSLRDDMAVPRQRNVFELMTRTHDKARTNHGKVANTGLEASELSDLTELEESDSEEGVGDQHGRSNTSQPKVAERDEPFERYAKEAREWKKGLDKLIDVSDKEKVSSSITSEIVSIIQAMKRLPKKDYKTEAFRTAVKRTGVAEAIRTICDPTFIIFNHTQQMLWLEHVYRIGDQLGEILDSWTPTDVVKGWKVKPDQFQVSTTGGGTIRSARTFIQVLNENTELIPGEENISYCFFLTSLDNFRWNYNRWLGIDQWSVMQMSRFNEENTLHVFYDQLLWQINEWCKRLQRTQDGGTNYIINLMTFPCEQLRTILKYTWWFRQVVKQSSEYAKKLTRCDKCEGRPGEERCCQYIRKPHIGNGLDEVEKEARLEILRQEVIGAGVTMVPATEQMERNPRTQSDDRTCKRYPGEGQMYHPHSIGKTHKYRLEGMERDPDIMARCGHQLLLVLDEKPSEGSEVAADCRNLRRTEIKDFAWWGALEQDKLALLQDAVVESTGVEPVTRGRQFESYIGGEMTALGSRSPSGGRAGDGYTSYSGLEARTERGLAILFKQAATSAMMVETAIHAHPDLAARLKEKAEQCDRMGMTGANIFNCTSYMAPIHRDKDATRGLCVQALLDADERYKEYAFCNIEYQYYITTTTNCLWSFSSSDLHGTMLPSKTTVQNLDSHAVDPNRRSGEALVGSAGEINFAPNTGSDPPEAGTSGPRAPDRGRGGRGRGGRGRGRATGREGGGGLRRSARNANQARPRPTVSNGAHVSVPSQNQARAMENARRRGQYEERSQYWDS
ncbi:hypothetical protein EV361DRAFT_951807 [Lentinula raphanica]|nr:hypothetical protein EV361DRAFT_951807 [Lentinula raphanica]